MSCHWELGLGPLSKSSFIFLGLQRLLFRFPRYGSSYVGMPPEKDRVDMGPLMWGCLPNVWSEIDIVDRDEETLPKIELLSSRKSAFRNENKRFGMTEIRTPDLEL